MSHVQVSKIIELPHPFAGNKWWYEFSSALTNLDEKAIRKFVQNKQKSFAKLAKDWNDELNTEWTCRIFYSLKMILAASVFLGNLEYARERNLKACVPYLQYYSLLYSLSALVLTLPDKEWNNGGLVTQSHKKTINVACAEIGKVSPEWKDKTKQQVLELKAFRELISYRAPSSGGDFNKFDIDVNQLCRVPVELAQMVSEVLEESLGKYIPPGYKPVLIESDLEIIFMSEIEGHTFTDDKDLYRIGYLFRKHPMPTNIMHMMSEGHVEDFFGSWVDDEGRDDVFNPDEYWRVLFNTP